MVPGDFALQPQFAHGFLHEVDLAAEDPGEPVFEFGEAAEMGESGRGASAIEAHRKSTSPGLLSPRAMELNRDALRTPAPRSSRSWVLRTWIACSRPMPSIILHSRSAGSSLEQWSGSVPGVRVTAGDPDSSTGRQEEEAAEHAPVHQRAIARVRCQEVKRPSV